MRGSFQRVARALRRLWFFRWACLSGRVTWGFCVKRVRLYTRDHLEGSTSCFVVRLKVSKVVRRPGDVGEWNKR